MTEFYFLCRINYWHMRLNYLLRIRRNYLLLVAAFVWTIAGAMLLFRGYTLQIDRRPNGWISELMISLVAGILFYWLLFTRISLKHVRRIQSLSVERPYFWEFFNGRSYLLMFSMITLGISLRLSGLVSPEYLAVLYITMGIPLLTSSFRFFYAFFRQ